MVYYGDVRNSLGLMRLFEDPVNCVITSPPYFGLRSYLPDGHPLKAFEIGAERTVDEYVEHLVQVFRLVRDVLRDDGTVWLNLGDSYASNSVSPAPQGATGLRASRTFTAATAGNRYKASDIGLKPKDLICVPWRVALALQTDGWYLRQDIIWHKPNPMPESVTDRCTRAHEYVFLLSKKAKYHFDADAMREPASQPLGTAKLTRQHKRLELGQATSTSSLGSNQGKPWRNRRSVWSVSPKPYSGAHFATFPDTLIEPMLLASCPPGGTVLDPFMGSGTTAMVAERHGRNWLGCDINEDNRALVNERLERERSPK